MDLDLIIKNAINQCHSKHDLMSFKKMIYCFTTENISGYIDEFKLFNKSLLTVGSSGDQVLNAILRGCDDVTLFDINPYAIYYLYLKITALLSLTKEEYCEFFWPPESRFAYNRKFLDSSNLQKVIESLKSVNYDAYLFWSTLLENVPKKLIKKNLFFSEKYDKRVIQTINPYLHSESVYELLRRRVENANITFINGNVLGENNLGNYDNIWLSNICCYLSLSEIKELVDKMSGHLNASGKLLISYLYDIMYETPDYDESSSIYNFKKTFELLEEYNDGLEMISFAGVTGMQIRTMDQDGALIYTRKK